MNRKIKKVILLILGKIISKLLRYFILHANERERINIFQNICDFLKINSVSKEIAPQLFINISTKDNWGLRKLYLHFNSNSEYCSSIYNRGWLNIQLTQIEFIKNIITTMPKPVVFWDIGANYGLYSLLISKYVYQIIAIEPSSETCQLFSKSCKMSNLNTISIYEGAASSYDGYGDVYLSPIHHGDHRIYQPVNEIMRESKKIIVRKLDTIAMELLESFPENNFIKLDVQGSELDVLKGSEKLIYNSKIMYMLLEWGNNEHADRGVDSKELLYSLQDLGMLFYYDSKKIEPLKMERILEEEFLLDKVVKDYLLIKKS